MASNKDSKTSKTAHVMNLLSKNRNAPPAEPVSESAPASPEPAAAAPAAAAPIAPIITSINADAAVSSQIKDALEASLTPAEPPVQTPPPAPRPSAPEPARTASVTPQPPAAEPAPQPEPTSIPQQPPEPAAPAAEPSQREEYEPPAYVNVMEVLVREKAEKYMRTSGMCCCDHCMVDVMAYTLNHLPPKYVVMSKGEMIPKLTFYEVQHSSDVTTQLMRACEVVSKSPHHGRG
ncbi:late competence development ComFB family protein [Oscillibacter sp.]|jgi:hypothetical protein|uniref:late competence development ComFB family protein n=1 Tax=Oscillibacter sp. TaxID=1945593 RepID=UPI00216C9695|nr:late competence development ComFB family protein [Oscillibacter sp.]MCI9647881.1 late competence development ComFB family protein [Oscillibacter sp.]